MVTIADVLNQWEAIGVFDLLLPFLLIFALVYAILVRMKIFKDMKGVSVVIAVVVGLLALRLGFVQRFFIEVFPRLGVGLAVLLVILILAGLFISGLETKAKGVMMWILVAVGIIIAIIVLSGSFAEYGWYADWTSSNLVVWVISIAALIGLIVAIVSSGKGDDRPNKKYKVGFFPEQD